MLFIVTHVHAPDHCPSGDPEMMKKTVGALAGESTAKKANVKVLGSYIAPPEHTLFFILDADTYDNIVNFFEPAMKLGTAKIVPVTPLKTVV